MANFANSKQEFKHDFFALNMNDLEAKLDTIPLYDIIDLSRDELDEETKLILDKYANESENHWKDRLGQGANYETLEDVNQKIIKTLTVKTETVQDSKSKCVREDNKEDEDLEDWLNDYLN